MWYEDAQWWAVIIALLLGVTGVFQDNVRKFFKKPKLKVSIDLQPPDCHKIAISDAKTRFRICDSYYFRFCIKNLGKSRLEESEAMIMKIYKKKLSGEYEKVNNFLPLNLVWSHQGGVVVDKIQPYFFKHLDFGHMVKSEFAQLEYYNINSNCKVAFLLDLSTIPNTGSHILLPGDYKVYIQFGSSNIKPQLKIFNLVISDDWSDNEHKMFSDNVSIKEISK